MRTNTILESVAAGRPGEGKHRLAVVTPKFRPTIGGLEEYAYQIALGFNERDDYDVIVLTSNHEGHRTVVDVVDGLTVFRFPRWFKVSETPINLLWPWYLRRAMADNRIDVVNAHTPVPFMVEAAAMASGTRPLVITYHAGSMVKDKPIPDLLIRSYERWVLPRLLRRADAVVSVTAASGVALRAATGREELPCPSRRGRQQVRARGCRRRAVGAHAALRRADRSFVGMEGDRPAGSSLRDRAEGASRTPNSSWSAAATPSRTIGDWPLLWAWLRVWSSGESSTGPHS